MAPAKTGIGLNVIRGSRLSKMPVMNSGADPPLYTEALKKRSLLVSNPRMPWPRLGE